MNLGTSLRDFWHIFFSKDRDTDWMMFYLNMGQVAFMNGYALDDCPFKKVNCLWSLDCFREIWWKCGWKVAEQDRR